MNRPTVFRQMALNRLSSPDEIDRVLRVTSPRGWIALAALAILVVSSLTWACAAVIPLTVPGQGILLKSGGIFEVVSDASGRVLDIAVEIGDTVREGQVVARMAQPQLAEQVQQAKATLAARRSERDEIVREGARETALQLAAIDEQRRALQDSLGPAEPSPASAHRAELAQLAVRRLQIRAEYDRQARRVALAVRDAESALAQLERELTSVSEIRSPYTGRVIEVAAEQGAVVDRGAPIVALDATGRTVTGLEAIVYVPARDGKRVKPGMTVQIAPATVRSEEYGYLLGKVTQVSELPATSRAMVRVLKNKELAVALSAGGPPHEVLVDLVPDQTTPSLHRWSSSKGPPMRIQSGTLCSAFIIFATRRPIDIVMPFLRVSDR